MNPNFTYQQIEVFGTTLRVPAQAVKTYLAKDAAVKEIDEINAKAKAEGFKILHDSRIDKNMGTIIRANRRIEREGWYSYRV